MDKKERDKIIRECAKEVFGPEGFLFSASKRSMADDNGYFLTCVYVEPCNLGGIFISVLVRFLWSGDIGSRWLYDTVDEYGQYNERIRYFGPNSFRGECLLYSENDTPEKFRNCVHTFMTDALKAALSYRLKSDVQIMYKTLWDWSDPLRSKKDYKNSDFDIAMITALHNDTEKAKRILCGAIKETNEPIHGQYHSMLLEYYQALSDSNDKFLDLLNSRIMEARKKCHTTYKKIDLNKRVF